MEGTRCYANANKHGSHARTHSLRVPTPHASTPPHLQPPKETAGHALGVRRSVIAARGAHLPLRARPCSSGGGGSPLLPGCCCSCCCCCPSCLLLPLPSSSPAGASSMLRVACCSWCPSLPPLLLLLLPLQRGAAAAGGGGAAGGGDSGGGRGAGVSLLRLAAVPMIVA